MPDESEFAETVDWLAAAHDCAVKWRVLCEKLENKRQCAFYSRKAMTFERFSWNFGTDFGEAVFDLSDVSERFHNVMM